MSREQSSDLRDAPERLSSLSLTAADPARPAASTAGRSRKALAIFRIGFKPQSREQPRAAECGAQSRQRQPPVPARPSAPLGQHLTAVGAEQGPQVRGGAQWREADREPQEAAARFGFVAVRCKTSFFLSLSPISPFPPTLRSTANPGPHCATLRGAVKAEVTGSPNASVREVPDELSRSAAPWAWPEPSACPQVRPALGELAGTVV